MIHPSHVTRASDASRFDEICTNCGATDAAGDTSLYEGCPYIPKAAKCVFDLRAVPLEEYLANDHTCTPCSEQHNALLDGLVPRLKD